MAPTVAEWQRLYGDKVLIVVLLDGRDQEYQSTLAKMGLRDVLIDTEAKFYTAFHANGTPSAVLISNDGRIASWVAAGADSITRLIDQTTNVPDKASPSQLGLGADVAALSALSITLSELTETARATRRATTASCGDGLFASMAEHP